MKRYLQIPLAIFLLSPILTFAQQAAFEPEKINLTSLEAFEAGKNWRIASDVFYDYTGKENSRIISGTGILVNAITEKDKSHLFTKMVHGDIELELDFMIASNSNAGVYLQGRYEIQMFDSWGVKNLKSTDCAAIYERWDESRPEGSKGYEGHAAPQNVSKAPGLWQHLRIIFHAPRFNAAGAKTENAKFVLVEFNGVVVHVNTEVTGPTRAAHFKDEKPFGPVVIQGDHGAVAIRNIQYHLYNGQPVSLSAITRTSLDGSFRSIDAVDKALTSKANDRASIELMGPGIPENSKNFAGKIQGKIHVPKTGKYYFKLDLGWVPAETNAKAPNGGAEFKIAGKSIFTIDGKNGGTATGITELAKGEYDFSLVYYKTYALWYAKSDYIELGVEAPDYPFILLNGAPLSADAAGAMIVEVKDKPVMQRCFLLYDNKKKTNVISVGLPGGVNYAYDLSKGNLLQWWRGDFIETTLMWHERGEQQIALPLGSVTIGKDLPSLAVLTDANQAWPDSNTTYVFNGYKIKEGSPVFQFSLAGQLIEETFQSLDNGKQLFRSIVIGSADKNVWCRVASGVQVVKLNKDTYAVDDKRYYLKVSESDEVLIREGHGGKEILLRANPKSENKVQTIQYSIIW